MNLKYSFNKGTTYCIDTLFRFEAWTPITADATMNMYLTPYKITGPYNTGDPIPSLPGTNYEVMNSYVSSLNLNYDYYIPKTFTPDYNFPYLWYYPKATN